MAARPALAQVGKRNFPDPIITQDPNPSNELDITPIWAKAPDSETLSFGWTLEKQLSQVFSVQLSSSWNDPSCSDGTDCVPLSASRRRHHNKKKRRKERTRHPKSRDSLLPGPPVPGTGSGNLGVLLKWAFYESAEHEFRLAIGADGLFSVGNTKAGADTHNYIGPMLMVAKGMGDLPHPVRYLQPLCLQADGGFATKTGGPAANDVYFDAMLSYDFSYLADNVIHRQLPWPLDHLLPLTEFSYAGVVGQHGPGFTPDLRIYPGLGWQQGPYQLAVEADLALNKGTVAYDHAGILALLDVALDQLDPLFGWTPF